MYELIIIGAGPAGLTAALYAGRFRLKTLVLEKLSPGGRILMSESIENYPGFPGGISTRELMRGMEKQVRDLEVEIRAEEARELDCRAKVLKTDSAVYSAQALIIAVGARPRPLGVPGEEKLTGRGVSYCATCDAPLYKNKNVVIIGGGDSVAEEALHLARFAGTVTIIHRRGKMRASAILQEKLKQDKKINFLLNSTVEEISGTDKVEAVAVQDVLTQATTKVPCDGVFIYVGHQPDTGLVKSQLKLDEAGFIITSEEMHTSSEGVFACGDCRKKSFYQVITACGEGAQAADSAYKYITQIGQAK